MLGALGFAGSCYATNGYQLMGIGAYQKSLGGAVTAKPGSAMTAITNPAGLATIPDRADFSMEAFMPDRSTDFGPMGGDKVDSDTTLYGVPSLGWKAPVSEGSNLYFGGGMYGTSGMGVDYAQTFMTPQSPFPNPDMYWDGYSNIAFWQMAPALAGKVNNEFSWGVSLNIDYQSVAFKQRVQADTNGDGAIDTTVGNFDLSKSAQAFGYGMSFGVLFDVMENLTLGASYKSKQYFPDLKYNLGYGDIQNQAFIGAPFAGPGGELPGGKYKLGLDYPQQAAVGLAFKVMPQFTISADVKWINWSDTMEKLEIKGGGVTIPYEANWDDQWVYALGLEFAVNEQLKLRAGFNYAEAPFGDSDVANNLILPAVVEQHYSVGGDYQINKHWGVGFHYMYVPEEELQSPASNDPTTFPGTKIKMHENSVGINLGYLF
jgi:long-chain fatty acid transport protein